MTVPRFLNSSNSTCSYISDGACVRLGKPVSNQPLPRKLLVHLSSEALSCTSGVGALRDTNGNLVTDDKQRADMLNSFLSQLVVVTMVMCQLCRHVLKSEHSLTRRDCHCGHQIKFNFWARQFSTTVI